MVEYEEWAVLSSSGATSESGTNNNLAHACAKLPLISEDEFRHIDVPKLNAFPAEAFLGIGFSHHRVILQKVKDLPDITWMNLARISLSTFSFSIAH